MLHGARERGFSPSSRKTFFGLLVVSCIVLGPRAAAAANVTVDCTGATPGAFATITAALASLATNGPHTITVSGECAGEALVIRGYNQLTIQGAPGTMAVVSQPVTACGVAPSSPGGSASVLRIVDSHEVLMIALALRGGQGVTIEDSSSIQFRNVTIEDSRGNGLNVGSGGASLQGRAGVTATPNMVRNNCSSGINVGATAVVNVNFNTAIAGNGMGLQVNGSATVNGDAAGPVVIENNRANGIRVFNGRLTIGQVVVQNNSTDPNMLAAAGIWAASGSIVDAVPGGLQVIGNRGPGIWAQISSIVLLGPIVAPSATVDVTLSGNTEEGLRLTQNSVANVFAGNVMAGNGAKGDATCDHSSLIFGDVSGIGMLKCARVEK